ncbi:MAG: type II toxin-antitoxin system MqsA family antitoxin [Leptolyngbya sp.]|nr:type II toxin-antitoxin system MqsA family antitoxin [Candidatus Melainabacteria bacterium]
MKCVSCGAAKMVRETRDVDYVYKGQATKILSVSGEYCPKCNESVHGEAESERLNAEMLAFNKEVNCSTVDPSFIIETRKKLKLDQREASIIFGGGSNGFSRYENGKTRPPLSLIQLFKLLNNHPELLDEIRPAKQTNTDSETEKKIVRRKKLYA